MEWKRALDILPPELRQSILSLEQKPEEVRLRCGHAPVVRLPKEERRLSLFSVDAQLLERTVERAAKQSVYAAQDMLRSGFLTVPGGHRLGVCGTGVYKNGELTSLRYISSLNLRIAGAVPGCGGKLADHLWTHPVSTLIIGPPGRGKTTVLRDLICQVTRRFAWRVSVVDERRELAACIEGKPQFDLGADVLDGVKKADGISMLLRSMNPQWIAVDEITAAEDVEAMLQASYCGIRFLATAHAEGMEELRRRPVYRRLLEARLFEALAVICPDRSIRWEALQCSD